MEYNQLNVSKYVSEALPEIISEVRTGNNIMLKAPTGSGKTVAMLEMRKQFVGKRIAFLCPTRSLVDNIKEKGPGVPCGYGAEFLNANRREYFVVTTWESILRMLKWEHPPELIIIDEAHLIIGHSNFRDVVPTLLSAKAQTIFISATPEIIENFPGLTGLEICPPVVYKDIHIAELGSRRPYTVIQDIIAARQPERIGENPEGGEEYLGRGNILIIRHNNKNRLREIYAGLPREVREVTAMFHSDKAELYEVFPDDTPDKLSKGEVPKHIEILLITSIYDAGLSLKVDRDVDCWAVTHSGDKMPHPIDMIQLQHRVREDTGKAINLTVVGNYGENTLNDIQPLKPARAEIWLQRTQVEYELYRQLNEDAYKGILNYYDVRSHNARLPERQPRQYATRLRLIDLARNMASFPEQYEQILQRLKHANYGDWAEYINGTQAVRFDDTPPQAVAIKLQLLAAIECDLHFSLFMDGDIYQEKRVRHLTEAVGLYSRGGRFKTVIDQLFANGLSDVVMPLEDYGLLPKEQQKIVRTVAGLFYENVKFQDGRAERKLKAKKVTEAERYYKCLLNGKDNIWSLVA